MVTVVFWNVAGNQNVLPHLACLALKHRVDIFLLAECPSDFPTAIKALNEIENGVYHEAHNGVSKIRAATRLNGATFKHRFTGIAGDIAVWSLRSLHVRPANEILLAGVHLPSKVGGWKEADQAEIAREIAWQLNDVEDGQGHRNTVMVGDFNMFPYDPGMTSVTGFHGLMTRRLAEQPDRLFRKRRWRRFYNPMWGLLGDRTPGPAGSYRWDSNAPHNPHWGMLDQLLLRKGLIDRLADLMILDHDGVHPLLGNDGFPDRIGMSDHLPLLFRLDV